jgi:hypothetical protein
MSIGAVTLPFQGAIVSNCCSCPMASTCRADLHVREGGAVAGGTLPQAQSGAF